MSLPAWAASALLLPALARPATHAAAPSVSPQQTSLAALAAEIRAAMPELSPRNLYVPGFAGLDAGQAASLKLPESSVPFPAAWNPALAAALLKRAEALEPAASQAMGRAEPQAKPLLERINAVLADFAPEDLARMPAEDLQHLASVILEQGGSFGGLTERSLPGAALLSRRRAELIKARMSEQPKLHQPYPNVLDGHEMPRYTRDVPASARFVEAPYPVLRHYLSRDRLEKASVKGVLGNAVLPYVRRTLGVWHDYYETLTGLFLTLPEVPGERVGVREDLGSYVDVKIPPSFPLIEVEPGRIFLVPLPGLPESWVRELYFRWIGGDAGALSYHGQLPRLEENGGPGPHLHVPAEIVGSGTR